MGITGLRFHDLRHEATSRPFELGWTPANVVEVTGHKAYAMIARYTHLNAERLADELAALAA